MRYPTRGFSRLAIWAASIGFFCAGVGSVALLSQGPECTNEPFTFLYPSPSFIRNQGGSGITAWRKSTISNCPAQAVSQVNWITVFPNQSPTSSGVAFFTVQPGVTDPRVGSLRVSSFAGSPDSSDFSVVQAGVRDPIITTPSELPPARQGVPYSVQLAFSTVAGGPPGPVSWSVRSGTGLPPGLALSESGLLSGTPTQSGTYGLSVGATLAGSIYTDIQGFSLQVISTSPQQFFRLPPCRVMDTRVGGGKSPPFGPPILTPGDTRTDSCARRRLRRTRLGDRFLAECHCGSRRAAGLPVDLAFEYAAPSRLHVKRF